MIENSTQLQEVEIAGERLDENIEKTNMSQVKLKIQNVKTIPAILGEVDVLKAVSVITRNFKRRRRKFWTIC